MYDVKTLCQKCNISVQTFYRLTRMNETFRALVENNRLKRGSCYYYDIPVLDWLYSYYSISPEEVNTDPEINTDPPSASEETASEGSPAVLEAERRNAALVEEIDRLKRRIEDLTAKLKSCENEKQALLSQNGQLLLLLSQEKQEKQALLPPPRKPIGERIRTLFHRSREE